MQTLLYEDITKEKLLEHNGKGISILLNDEVFFVLVNIVDKSNELIVLSGGAIDRTKKSPPVFMRSKWKEEIKQNSVFIDDKTIHGTNLKIGWGIGNKERHFLIDYSKIVKKISEVLKIDNKNIMYYGSSMGGFMSILMSTMHKDTFAVVNNPQTNVFKYKNPSVDSLCQELFPGLEKKDIFNTFPERLSVIEAFKLYKYIPKIFYFQNDKSKFDMDNHVRPFMKSLEEFLPENNQISFNFYSDPVKGHNPMVKSKTLDIINNIFEENKKY